MLEDAFFSCDIWTAEMKWKWRNDHRNERNLCNLRKEAWKKFRTSTGFEPVEPNWRAPNVSAFIAQLVRASHRHREVTGSNPVEVLNFFFQASLRNCINCVHCNDHFFIFIANIMLHKSWLLFVATLNLHLLVRVKSCIGETWRGRKNHLVYIFFIVNCIYWLSPPHPNPKPGRLVQPLICCFFEKVGVVHRWSHGQSRW